VGANDSVTSLSVSMGSPHHAAHCAHVPFSLFLKFLWLEIMYFPWPKMKALE
jgi:hypothetical protein